MSPKKIKKRLLKIDPHFITLEIQRDCLSTACAYDLDKMIHKFSDVQVGEKCYMKCFNSILETGEPATIKALIVSIVNYTDIEKLTLLKRLKEKREELIMF